MKCNFWKMWLRIFLMVVLGGLMLAAISRAMFPQPAYASLSQKILASDQKKSGEHKNGIDARAYPY